MADPDKLLKLRALDEEDLTVLSAHMQDAVLKPADIVFDKQSGNLVVPMNRFAWEAPQRRKLFFKRYQRRQSALRLAKVTGVRSRGLDTQANDAVLSLLNISFDAVEAPSGTIIFIFSGGARLEARVECVEIELTDLGGAWEASNTPRH